MGESLYNFKQRVTKSNNIIVNHILPEPPQKSGRTLIVYCILCKYVIVMCRSYAPTRYSVLFFYTTMSECMIFFMGL